MTEERRPCINRWHIVYSGGKPKEWQGWDRETYFGKAHKIVVYPAWENHDLHGDQKTTMGTTLRVSAIKEKPLLLRAD